MIVLVNGHWYQAQEQTPAGDPYQTSTGEIDWNLMVDSETETPLRA